MKTQTLNELLLLISPLPWSGDTRVHPAIDVGGGDGPTEMSEVSSEHGGGDWYDVAYCHNPHDARLAAHAANLLPELVAMLEEVEHMVGDYHEREGCPFTLCGFRDLLSRASTLPHP